MFYVAHFGASTSSSEQWETSWSILSIGWTSVWHKIRTISMSFILK
ncbi:rCG44041, isoform CRA_b [Rattus norvegicus]|uniref:RCG44041, isoform CRA_b n=1 Tax=Rattus norvegicus TaxID=10116 RepID=A6J765_RAT|nr:rCG44041, isoform CRA_b [Rattus norvegicus]